MILVVLALLTVVQPLNTGGRCHIQFGGRIFYLKSLETTPYYEYRSGDNTYLFNFCQAVEAPEPWECPPAYAMVLRNNNGTCESYTSDSLLYLYESRLYNQSGELGVTILEQSGVPVSEGSTLNRTANITVVCEPNTAGFEITDASLDDFTGRLTIVGRSVHGCPALEISSLWEALYDNAIIFGIVLFGAGITELFFGRKMLNPTIFIAAYCLSFAVLGGILSGFVLKPDSSLILIYFSLLLALFLSSCIAYVVMGMTHISMFVVGAWMGLIVAALVNSIFIKIFKVYSVWSLVGFAVVFCILLGILGYRYYDHIIILSTSLTGAYMIVRPVSWIFGGFPNEFLLAEEIKAGSLPTLPSIFFVYLALILVLMIVGATYQFLQLRREQAYVADSAIEIGMVEGKIEAGVYSIRNSVNALINRYRSPDDGEEYRKEGQYIEFQEYHKLDGYKPLYPHLYSNVNRNNERASDRNSLKENISISGSFLRYMSEKQRYFGEESPTKQYSKPSREYTPPLPDVKRMSVESEERPSRDSGTLNRKLEEVRKSGSRFSKEHLAGEYEEQQKPPTYRAASSSSHKSKRSSEAPEPPRVGPQP